MSKRIIVAGCSVGGGHRRVAETLVDSVQMRYPGWTVEWMDAYKLVEPLDPLFNRVSVSLLSLYWRLSVYSVPMVVPLLFLLIKALFSRKRAAGSRLFSAYFRNHPADMVISVVPFINQTLFEGLKQVAPQVPFVTVITDVADVPPHYFIEDQPQYYICPTAKALGQVRLLAKQRTKAFQISGIPVGAAFYKNQDVDRVVERRCHGLNPDRMTGLVFFGHEGSPHLLTVARRLERVSSDLQYIFICGRNTRLADRLRSMTTRYAKLVLDYSREIPYWMTLSDFMIGKPGGVSLSEAVHMRLPVITVLNQRTLPQERLNAQWIRDKNLGIVLSRYSDVDHAVSAVVRAESYTQTHLNLSRIRNRAIYEIPDILATVFGLSTTSQADHARQMLALQE